MNKTKIEWCDYTWNILTGCNHPCVYCYARKIANRFSMIKQDTTIQEIKELLEMVYGLDDGTDFNITGECISINSPVGCERHEPYPFNFRPTFHRYRLDEPKRKTKGQKIFVVSMGDLFGEWVPDEWIEEVFKACEAAPQHKYIFLTKNPSRLREVFWYKKLATLKDNYFLGTTVTNANDLYNAAEISCFKNSFLSIEPLQGEIDFNVEFETPLGDPLVNPLELLKWIIIGAQTGPGAKQPKPEWVESIIDQARSAGVPVFLKNNLGWHEDIQEFPEGLKEE